MTSVIDRIQLFEGDIVDQKVDAIVNAANSELREGTGVCGAIFAAAGPQMTDACRAMGHCPAGDARITPGFRLHAQHVIHAVGPVYRDGDSAGAERLSSAYRASLELCEINDCRSVAFPAISTGIYGYPKDQAAQIAISTVIDWLTTHSLPEVVHFVLFSHEDFELYDHLLNNWG